MVNSFGDIVLASGGNFTSKPRPVLVFQNSRHSTGLSTIVVPFTSVPDKAAYYRLGITADKRNGLQKNCYLEVDKLGAVKNSWLGRRIGKLDSESLERALELSRELLSPP